MVIIDLEANAALLAGAVVNNPPRVTTVAIIGMAIGVKNSLTYSLENYGIFPAKLSIDSSINALFSYIWAPNFLRLKICTGFFQNLAFGTSIFDDCL